MTSFWKVAAPVACAAVIYGAAILWPIYRAQATERELAEALKEVRVRADRGDAEAQDRLGYSCRWGAGVRQDYAEAFRWYRKAADQGNAHAQYSVGLMYHHGQGVRRDDAESASWYRKAADQGYASAQTSLG